VAYFNLKLGSVFELDIKFYRSRKQDAFFLRTDTRALPLHRNSDDWSRAFVELVFIVTVAYVMYVSSRGLFVENVHRKKGMYCSPVATVCLSQLLFACLNCLP
jgi:hypothetical protein